MAYKGCRAYRQITDQSIPKTTNTLVEFNGETHDTDAFHSTTVSPSRITIPDGHDGTYRVYTQIRWETNAVGYRRVRVLKNGSIINEYVHDADAASVTTTLLCDSITLEAGDYVEVQVYHTVAAGAIDVLLAEQYTFFGVDLLGA